MACVLGLGLTALAAAPPARAGTEVTYETVGVVTGHRKTPPMTIGRIALGIADSVMTGIQVSTPVGALATMGADALSTPQAPQAATPDEKGTTYELFVRVHRRDYRIEVSERKFAETGIGATVPVVRTVSGDPGGRGDGKASVTVRLAD